MQNMVDRLLLLKAENELGPKDRLMIEEELINYQATVRWMERMLAGDEVGNPPLDVSLDLPMLEVQ